MFFYYTQGLWECLWLTPFLVFWLLLVYLYCRRSRQPWRWGKMLGTALLFYALVLMFYVTGTLSITEVFRFKTSIVADSMNLIPFFGASMQGLVLNTLLFIPVGFLLPIIWDSYCHLGKTTLTGFLLSLLIEVSQLFNLRATDVDDLLMNTLGCLLGGAMAMVLCLSSKRKKALKLQPKIGGMGNQQGLWLMLYVFACHFFFTSLVQGMVS